MKNGQRCVIFCDGKSFDLYRVKLSSQTVGDDTNDLHIACELVSSHSSINQAAAAADAWMLAQAAVKK